MSHIIANPSVETDMTSYFVCKLYREDYNNMEVRNNGMDPYEIWESLHYNAFDKLVVPMILNRLISNNMVRGFITYNPESRRVLITTEGRRWGEAGCRNMAGI
jgi:hypothetical protein